MKNFRFTIIIELILLLFLASCSQQQDYHEDFNSINDRTWINPDLWSIPIEDWQVKDGRLECTGSRKNMKVVLLTHLLKNEGNFLINLRMGLIEKAETPGSGGLILGLHDDTDMDIRSLAYFGTGLNAGVNTEKQLFLGEISKALPEAFDLYDFILHIDGYHEGGKILVRLQATDKNGLKTDKIEKKDLEVLEGAVAVINNHPGGRGYEGNNRFWFDDLNLSGSAIVRQEDNSFGPILWSMYTLSKGVMKMSVQMPPMGVMDNQEIELYLKNDGQWDLAGRETMDDYSRTSVFRIENWDSQIEHRYRIVYRETGRQKAEKEFWREGIIAAEPLERPLVMGGLTCQYHYGFPYQPLVGNLDKLNPDILYFSGDQIYEGNGGYGIIRFPADSAILNYLGKWYLFGWAFGDLMRDRPTISIPDDHDIFQGNLWGNGGNNIDFDTFRQFQGTSGGYVEPAAFVQAVHKTQCGHLPDCYSNALMDQGIKPYFTELVYSRVSFAIVGDRMFKSGPKEVATWDGRKDHIQDPGFNLASIDPPGLKLLGESQMDFLREWAKDWSGSDMKCLLSQTIFTNIATHHGGNKMVLYADLDSGGWPITPRNKVIEILRSCFAFHIAGDQHLPSLTQYGIDNFRDGNWAFCTPAITVGYQRRFKPESIGLAISDPPEHNLPNTGKYRDPFGHPSYVYAVGNPEEDTRAANRYERAQKCSSGFGIIKFDKIDRTITTEAYHFLADLTDNDKSNDQFPGWPLTIDQLDNNGREIYGYLDPIELDSQEEIVQVYSEKTGDLVYSLRPENNSFTPRVFNSGQYRVKIINSETGEVREKSLHLQAQKK